VSQPPGVCSPTTRSSVSPGCRSRSETEQTPGCCVSTVARTCLGKLLPKLSAEGLRVETARYVAKHAIHVVSRPTRHPRPHFPRLVPHACFMAPRRLSAQLCKGSFECSVVLTGPLVLCGEVVLCFECSRHLSTCRALSSTPHQYDQSKKAIQQRVELPCFSWWQTHKRTPSCLHTHSHRTFSMIQQRCEERLKASGLPRVRPETCIVSGTRSRV
jgi:hypothetical protein